MLDQEFFISIFLFLALIVLSAFFSGSEVAFFSLQPASRRFFEHHRSLLHTLVLRLLSKPNRLLITILIGNTVVNISAAIVAAFFSLRIALYFQLLEFAVVFIQIVVVTLVLLILGEIAPKVVAMKYAVAYCRVAAIPLTITTVLLLPVSILFERITSRVGRTLEPLRLRKDLTGEEMKALADVGEEHGALHDVEHDIIHRIADLRGLTVRHVMISRVDMRAIDVAAPWGNVLSAFRESGLSRIPVYDGQIDNIVGVLYAKDALRYVDREMLPNGLELRTLLRPAMVVPESKTIEELVHEFRASRKHMAIVLDEYGGVAGLVTFDDIIAEIFGEGLRERTIQAAHVRKIDDATFIMAGSTPLTEAEEVLGVDLLEGSDEYTTIAGLILALAGGFPKVKQELQYKNLTLTVLSVDKRRIRQVQVRRWATSRESSVG